MAGMAGIAAISQEPRSRLKPRGLMFCYSREAENRLSSWLEQKRRSTEKLQEQNGLRSIPAHNGVARQQGGEPARIQAEWDSHEVSRIRQVQSPCSVMPRPRLWCQQPTCGPCWLTQAFSKSYDEQVK